MTTTAIGVARRLRVLFFVAVAVAAAGLAVQLAGTAGGLRSAAIAMIAVYLIWIVIEVPITFAGPAAVLDSRTPTPYALARLATLGGAVLLPLPWPAWSPALLVAMALLAFGIGVRVTAIVTLGRYYSHHVARQAGQTTVTTGLYRLVRHPSYAGMLLAHIGFVAFFLNPASVLGLLLLTAAVVWRIRIEERALWDMPGYAEYASGRRRLLPGVW